MCCNKGSFTSLYFLNDKINQITFIPNYFIQVTQNSCVITTIIYVGIYSSTQFITVSQLVFITL